MFKHVYQNSSSVIRNWLIIDSGSRHNRVTNTMYDCLLNVGLRIFPIHVPTSTLVASYCWTSISLSTVSFSLKQQLKLLHQNEHMIQISQNSLLYFLRNLNTSVLLEKERYAKRFINFEHPTIQKFNGSFVVNDV